MGTNREPVTFFIGSATADNIQILLDNLSFMLGDESQTHLITTAPEQIDESVRKQYFIFGQDYDKGFKGAVQALWDYHKEHNPRVIVQLTAPVIHGGLVGTIAKRFDVPSVYRYSGDRFDAYRHLSGSDKISAFFINNLIGTSSLKLFSKYIVLGPTGKQRLLDRGVHEENIAILPPSLNQSRVAETEELPNIDIPPSRSVALFLGRMTRLKGSETLERTIPKILDCRDDIHFVFVGESQDINIFDMYDDHISAVGRVAPDEVPRYIHLADVLIHPSLTEGLPRAILESLAAGTPVIARDVGEISSVTTNVFTTEAEFVDMVCDFERLYLDDVKQFTRQVVADQYKSFFRRF